MDSAICDAQGKAGIGRRIIEQHNGVFATCCLNKRT
jgi:hypothetical protein